jgi:hypothetical protein
LRFLLSALDAHDIGARECIDAMPKRQEAIPAPRRRLGRTGSAAVERSLAAQAGQVKDAAQQSALDEQSVRAVARNPSGPIPW